MTIHGHSVEVQCGTRLKKDGTYQAVVRVICRGQGCQEKGEHGLENAEDGFLEEADARKAADDRAKRVVAQYAQQAEVSDVQH